MNTDMNSGGAYGNDIVADYEGALSAFSNGTGSRESVLKAKRNFLADRGGTFVHESFIHAQAYTTNYLNGARSKKDMLAQGKYHSHHYYEHYNEGQTKYQTDGFRVIISIHKIFKTGKSSADIVKDAMNFARF